MSTVPDPQPTGKHVYVVRNADGEIETIFETQVEANGWIKASRKAVVPLAFEWRAEKWHIEKWTP